MEYTQWASGLSHYEETVGLNPCCNGIYSMRFAEGERNVVFICLNPCCNGIYLMSIRGFVAQEDGT